MNCISDHPRRRSHLAIHSLALIPIRPSPVLLKARASAHGPGTLLRLRLFTTQLLSSVLEDPQPQDVTSAGRGHDRIVRQFGSCPKSTVHRPSVIPKSFTFPRFRHFAFCILHFALSLRSHPLDGGGNSCPRNGPRSCGRYSAGNGSSSGRSNRCRSGPMIWSRIGTRSSNRNSVPFWYCTCTQTHTRSSCRNSRRSCYRTGARTRHCNSIRFGRCNGARPGSRFRPTNSSRAGPRTGSCNSTTSSRSPAQSPARGPNPEVESHEITKPDETKPIFFAPIRFVSFVPSWRPCRLPNSVSRLTLPQRPIS